MKRREEGDKKHFTPSLQAQKTALPLIHISKHTYVYKLLIYRGVHPPIRKDRVRAFVPQFYFLKFFLSNPKLSSL